MSALSIRRLSGALGAAIEDFDVAADLDDDVIDALRDALRGKGAFRRFKDVADRLDLIQDSYTQRDAAYASFARQWLQDSDIPFTDKV